MSLSAPITFTPHYFHRVWGGRQLATFLHRELPSEDHTYGESWELSDRPEAQSVVKEGPLAGMSLNTLWREHREAIFGKSFREHPSSVFPLLLKILDAKQPLSVQVHPCDASAKRVGGEAKSEWWYVIQRSEDSLIYAGLSEDNAWAERMQAQEAETLDARQLSQALMSELQSVNPKVGDSFVVPGGLIHALGQNMMVFEVQQNSDTCYRLYDWDRVDTLGVSRPLHWEQAQAVVDPNSQAIILPKADFDELSLPHFLLKQEHYVGGASQAVPFGGSFAIGMVAEGQVRVAGADFQHGDFFLIPANLTEDLRQAETLTSNSTVVWVSLPHQN